MMLIGYIDLTYGANIGAVSDIVRKTCLHGMAQISKSFQRSVLQAAEVDGKVKKSVSLEKFLRLDC